MVNETDDKEKLEQFINFCEDTIFEVSTERVHELTPSPPSRCNTPWPWVEKKTIKSLRRVTYPMWISFLVVRLRQNLWNSPCPTCGPVSKVSFISFVHRPSAMVINNFDKWHSKTWSKVSLHCSCSVFVSWWWSRSTPSGRWLAFRVLHAVAVKWISLQFACFSNHEIDIEQTLVRSHGSKICFARRAVPLSSRHVDDWLSVDIEAIAMR